MFLAVRGRCFSVPRRLLASLRPAGRFSHQIRDRWADQLRFVRREAQQEANDAYADWDGLRTVLAYAVYRAAQDRADAAQDDLAKFARRLAA